jgi:hypothetical protein
MARTCTVCVHAERAAIDRALVAGEPARAVAARYGTVGRMSLQRHRKDHLPALLAKAYEAEQSADAMRLKVELDRCFERVNLLFDACDRWLRDPTDPSRYDIGPRAEEMMVTYTEVPANEESKPRQRKASLAELLQRIDQAPVEAKPGRTVTMVETKHADPRELVLKTAARLQPQIELLAKLIGELDERPQVNILVSPEWIAVRAVVLEPLTPYPELRAAVAERLLQLEGG